MEDGIKKLEKFNESGVIEINGREYHLQKLSHQFRVECVALYSVIEPMLLVKNFSFLNDEKYKQLAKKIDDRVTFDDSQISKLPTHFEQYPEDYLEYVALTMGVIVYPFYKKGSVTP